MQGASCPAARFSGWLLRSPDPGLCLRLVSGEPFHGLANGQGGREARPDAGVARRQDAVVQAWVETAHGLIKAVLPRCIEAVVHRVAPVQVRAEFALAADDVLPGICSLLLSPVKDVTMEITVAPSTALREQLRHGQIDLLMGLMPESDDEFLCHPIIDDLVVLAAAASHPVFALPKATMRALLAYSWVLPAPSIPSRQWLNAAFESRSLPRPRVRIEANSIPLLPRLIARTDLLSFVSRHTMGPGRQHGLKEVVLRETTGNDTHPEAGRQPAPRGLSVARSTAAAGTAAFTRRRDIFQGPSARLSRQTERAQKVPGSRMPLSTVLMSVRPQKAIVMSSSLWMICSALVTPASPMAPRP